jgi:Putative heavy-metal chelation
VASQPTALRQPCHALEPDAFTLEAVEQWALERASHLAADRLRLTSLWYLDYIRQDVPEDRKTRYTVRLAQAENYGTAFGPISPLRDADHALVGEDSRQILKDRRFRDDIDRTALIDLVVGHVSAPASHQVVVDQVLREKYARRSRLFADEADAVLRRKGPGAIKRRQPCILVIGATSGIIDALVTRGLDVSATDMSPDVLGKSIGGVMVRDATENVSLIEAADLAIITGMTLPNRTLPGLIEAAKAHNTSTMIWAVTGKNLGHYYTEQGIDCVVSDPAPFLQLPGPATIGVWRREH